MGKNTILTALKVLHRSVFNSNLTDSEKNAMQIMIKKLIEFYEERYSVLIKNSRGNVMSEALLVLSSQMTDAIVIINDTLKGKCDVYSVINAVNKGINYDNKKGAFKGKRLI